MVKRTIAYSSLFGAVVIALIYLAWVTSPDPKWNEATFEESPLAESIAPLDEAITLAQFAGEDGQIVTAQVLGWTGDMITAVDLAEMGGSRASDPFQALASITSEPLNEETAAGFPTLEVNMSRILPTGSLGTQHIGTGTNFPEHAVEAGSSSVFSFPKFGKATPARTEVRAKPGILLDYEIELCIRFDRDIRSVEDFDAAVKGLFLCGDFTNRNALVDLADPDNLDSGYGFSDAKSGPDFFPTGPFLVVPKNWSSFISEMRMTTSVNGDPRQDARGGEMILDFRQLAEKSLGDMAEPRFLYADKFHFLALDEQIDVSTSLMSGTSEGVIFTSPTRGDIIAGALRYVADGGPFSENTLIDTVKETFIRNELESGHFLQPGDVVHYRSSYLGDIEIKVME